MSKTLRGPSFRHKYSPNLVDVYLGSATKAYFVRAASFSRLFLVLDVSRHENDRVTKLCSSLKFEGGGTLSRIVVVRNTTT